MAISAFGDCGNYFWNNHLVLSRKNHESDFSENDSKRFSKISLHSFSWNDKVGEKIPSIPSKPSTLNFDSLEKETRIDSSEANHQGWNLNQSP